jgi:hypothetical protein
LDYLKIPSPLWGEGQGEGNLNEMFPATLTRNRFAFAALSLAGRGGRVRVVKKKGIVYFSPLILPFSPEGRRDLEGESLFPLSIGERTKVRGNRNAGSISS